MIGKPRIEGFRFKVKVLITALALCWLASIDSASATTIDMSSFFQRAEQATIKNQQYLLREKRRIEQLESQARQVGKLSSKTALPQPQTPSIKPISGLCDCYTQNDPNNRDSKNFLYDKYDRRTFRRQPPCQCKLTDVPIRTTAPIAAPTNGTAGGNTSGYEWDINY
jgi:hypothetical protein